MNYYFPSQYAWSEPVHHDVYPVSGGWPAERAGLRWGVPGWRLGEVGSNRAVGDTDWSTVAKVGLVVGGALAVYLIYRASKVAEPIAERVGEAGANYLVARAGGAGARRLTGGSARGGSRVEVLPAHVVDTVYPGAAMDRKLLTA